MFCLIGRRSRRWSLGVQEQEIPDADHHNVKIPYAFYDMEIPDADHHNVKLLDAFYDVEFPIDQE